MGSNPTEKYTRSLAMSAVALTCTNYDFEAAQSSALETLVDVFQAYVEALAKTTKNYAESAGRTDSTLEDFLQAYEDKHPHIGDGACSKLFNWITKEEWDSCVGVLCDVPPFPLPDRTQLSGGMTTIGEMKQNRPKNVENFLPSFPPLHTYRSTAVDAVFREEGETNLRRQQLRENRLVQNNISELKNNNQNASRVSRRWGEAQSSEGNQMQIPSNSQNPNTNSSNKTTEVRNLYTKGFGTFEELQVQFQDSNSLSKSVHSLGDTSATSKTNNL